MRVLYPWINFNPTLYEQTLNQPALKKFETNPK